MTHIKMYISRFYLLVLFCLLLKSGYSDSYFTANNQKVIDNIYMETYYFHFQKADSLIYLNDIFYKDNLGFNLAVVNYYWWRLVSGEQNGKYVDLIANRIKTIEDAYSKNNAQIRDADLFLLISIFAFNARVSLIDNSYFSAISNLSKYYSFLKMSIGSEQKYNPFYLTSGLFIFFTGLAKVRVPVLSPFIKQYSTGNMVTGLDYIKIASSSVDWKISQEAKYFLMKINFDVYRNFTEAAKYCNQLMGAYPENLLFQLYMFRINLALNQVAFAKARIVIMEKTAGNNRQLTTDEKEFYIKLAVADLEAFSKKKI